MGKKQQKLTSKQRLFCDEWLIRRNAARAYQKIHQCKYETARVEGPKTLAKPACQAYLKPIIEKIEEQYALDLEKCIQEMARIGTSNILTFLNPITGEIDLKHVSHDEAAAIQEVTVETYEERTGIGNETETVKRTKIKLYDKRSALLELGKHFGGFKTKVEHSVGNELADLMKKARERSGKDG